MFIRAGILLAALVAAFAVVGASAQTQDKIVTISPTSGPPGTVVTAELFNAPPNDPITVMFQIPGDPIVATGTTDANGYAKFVFTIPYVPGGGTWPLFFTDFKCSCQIWVNFTVDNVRPTNTPTRVPTTPPPPPSATPTPTQVAAATPTATSTPAPPVLGSTSSMGGPGGPNIGILALGAMAVITVLSWFAATRGGAKPAMAVAYSRDEYSTDLDEATFEAMRRSADASSGANRGGSFGWALGAGLGAVAGLFMLKKK